MAILNIAIAAFLFCYRGRGGKFWYFAGMIILIGLQATSPWELLAWIWVLVVMGAFPTNGLLSATHGREPTREDHKIFRWMRECAQAVSVDDWFKYGRYYGLLRALPAVPAMVVIGNPFMLALLLHGDIYWLAGRFSDWFVESKLNLKLASFVSLINLRYNLMQPVIVAEVLTGALIGALI